MRKAKPRRLTDTQAERLWSHPAPATGVYRSRLTVGEEPTLTPSALPGPTIVVRALFD